MKISIIIPTYNRAAYLDEAVVSALAQDFPNIEVIIADNASTDNTQQLVEKYLGDRRVKYLRNKSNLGMVGNWREALYQYVTGDYFLILSDDDYLIDPTYISKAARLIAEQPGLLLVYAGGYIKHEQDGKFVPLEIPFERVVSGRKVFLSRGTVLPLDFTLCNVLFNTAASKALNCFDNDYNVCCDSELFLKLCLLGDVGVIDGQVSVYRVHGNNLVSKIMRDFDLFTNNWQHIFAPFRFGMVRRLLSVEEQELFFKGPVSRMIATSLINAKIAFPEKYYLIEERMKQDVAEEYVQAVKNQAKLRFFFTIDSVFGLSFVQKGIGFHRFLKGKLKFYK